MLFHWIISNLEYASLKFDFNIMVFYEKSGIFLYSTKNLTKT